MRSFSSACIEADAALQRRQRLRARVLRRRRRGRAPRSRSSRRRGCRAGRARLRASASARRVSSAVELRERALEVAHATGGLRLLQARVLVGALAHALAAQLRERAPRARHRVRESTSGCASANASSSSTRHELQVPPFAHDLALLVALLPAVHAVAGGALALVRGGLAPARPQRARAAAARTRRAPRGCGRGTARATAPRRSSARGSASAASRQRREQRVATGGEVRGHRRQPSRLARRFAPPWRNESSRLSQAAASVASPRSV